MMTLTTRIPTMQPNSDTPALTISGQRQDSRLRHSPQRTALMEALIRYELASSHSGNLDVLERAPSSSIFFSSGSNGLQLCRAVRMVAASFRFCDGATAEVHFANGSRQQCLIEYNAYA